MRAKNLIGATGLLAIAAALIGFVLWFSGQDEEPVLDASLCPRGVVLAAHTVILADQTDPLSPMQRQRLRHLIDNEARRLDQYEKLSVLALDAALPYEPATLFALCSPKTGRDENELTGNPGLAWRKWQREFGDPLNQALDLLMQTPKSETSPIMETVKGLTWRIDFGPNVVRRRLVIFSDMLQHSASWSHYGKRHSVDFARFSTTKSAGDLNADLRGVAVRLDYLERPQTLRLQSRAHRNFWLEYFAESGAEVGFWPDQPAVPERVQPKAETSTLVAHD